MPLSKGFEDFIIIIDTKYVSHIFIMSTSFLLLLTGSNIFSAVIAQNYHNSVVGVIWNKTSIVHW